FEPKFTSSHLRASGSVTPSSLFASGATAFIGSMFLRIAAATALQSLAAAATSSNVLITVETTCSADATMSSVTVTGRSVGAAAGGGGGGAAFLGGGLSALLHAASSANTMMVRMWGRYTAAPAEYRMQC